MQLGVQGHLTASEWSRLRREGHNLAKPISEDTPPGTQVPICCDYCGTQLMTYDSKSTLGGGFVCLQCPLDTCKRIITSRR